MLHFRKSPFPAFLLAVTVMFAGVSVGQTLPLIRSDSISIANGQVSIVVTDHGSGSTSYRLESSGTLVGTWDPITATPSISGNQITFTVTKPSATKLFYRVVGTAATGTPTPGDADGDGLSDDFEAIVAQGAANSYSDAILFDTDGDGSSDGEEFAYGTDPRNGNSMPDQRLLPAVEFGIVCTKATEGGGVLAIQLVSSAAVSTGVSVEVSTNSDIAQGDLATFSTSVAMSGGSGTLNLSFSDDLLISPAQRLVYIDIKDPIGITNYRTGGKTRHVIVLSENDGYWNGGFKGEGEVRSFRMKILRQGSVMQAYFVAGGAEDGLPQIEGEAVGFETSQTEGVIPLGEHTTSVPSNTPTRLEIVSSQLSMDTGTGGALGGMAGLQRRFTLLATPPLNGHIIDSHVISGSFTEEITIAGKPASHLDRTMTGAFAIVQALPAPPQ